MSIKDLVRIPQNINRGVSSARQATMLTLLGNPRTSYSDDCQGLSNPALAALIEPMMIGPNRVRGLRPAVESLRIVLQEIERREPEVYDALGSAGMLCARWVRGSRTSISNHSWGTAVDLTLYGTIDRYGDGWVEKGLARIYDIFNGYGWFWGAGFRKEDGMHFECSDQLIRQWYAEGRFGRPSVAALPQILSLGDRGVEVVDLQRRLIAEGAIGLVVDGEFGAATRAAVIAFQAANGLTPDGMVGPKTMAALMNVRIDAASELIG